jgi:hypothetical protein
MPNHTKLDEIFHKEIRNLRQYLDIWGESCPANELPYLIVFRGHDFKAQLEQLFLEVLPPEQDSLGKDHHVGKDPVIYDEKTGHHYNPIDYGYNKALKEVRTKLKTLLKGDIDE